ncbi:MAG: repressor LexA [Candidatus Kerfeldbacteria bacterium]|nr:repressor LexA [Candidatus Kerfeldbacteria bacterium]
MEKQITKRQKDLLSIIYQYIQDSGYPPTFEEMREKLGVSSNQSVVDLLKKLLDGGFIQRQASEARSVAILPRGYKALDQPSLAPFLGATTAGVPAESIEITGQWQQLSKEVERSRDVFILRVRGDSMMNAGINDNDMVLVEHREHFIHKDIVLAEVDHEATIKRFMSVDTPPYLYLKPENPAYENILFKDNVELKGKILGVLNSGTLKPVK